MVLWLLLRYIKLRTMTNVCLLNLALSDLILAITLPLWAYNSPNLASCKLMTGVYEVGPLGVWYLCLSLPLLLLSESLTKI